MAGSLFIDWQMDDVRDLSIRLEEQLHGDHIEIPQEPRESCIAQAGSLIQPIFTRVAAIEVSLLVVFATTGQVLSLGLIIASSIATIIDPPSPLAIEVALMLSICSGFILYAIVGTKADIPRAPVLVRRFDLQICSMGVMSLIALALGPSGVLAFSVCFIYFVMIAVGTTAQPQLPVMLSALFNRECDIMGTDVDSDSNGGKYVDLNAVGDWRYAIDGVTGHTFYYNLEHGVCAPKQPDAA